MGIYSQAQFTKTGINSVKNDWGKQDLDAGFWGFFLENTV